MDTVECIVKGVLTSAAKQAAAQGSFKLAGMLTMKLLYKPETKARNGVHPKTRKPCVFKAKPPRKVVKVKATAKLQRVNWIRWDIEG